MNGGVLVLSWLVLGHLLADFVLQPDHVATRKFGRGPEAWRALGMHVLIVGVVAAPIVLVYGLPGVAYVAVTVITHLLIDRTKIEATLRQCLRGVAEANGSATPTVDAQVRASALTAFVVGRLQRFARSGFKRPPSEHLEASVALML